MFKIRDVCNRKENILLRRIKEFFKKERKWKEKRKREKGRGGKG